MALTRQQKRFTERLLEDDAKIERIAQKQSDARLVKMDEDRNALISKRAEVLLVSILIWFGYAFFIYGS